jgi:hypothetical protein
MLAFRETPADHGRAERDRAAKEAGRERHEMGAVRRARGRAVGRPCICGIGIFGFIVFLAWLVWVLVISFMLYRPQQEAARPI